MATATITSKLYVYLQLVSVSSYFPMLVKGAAMFRGRSYDQKMLEYVAGQPAVLGAINLTIADGRVSSVDTLLEAMLGSSGAAVDSVIISAVDAYAASLV